MTAAELHEKYKYCDIKAEVVAADLVYQQKSLDNIVIRLAGIFNRNFRNDILGFESAESGSRNEDSLLFIDVSREGIFDALPQGLFYQASGKKIDNLDEKIQELRMQRHEDAEARKFFSVLEKEFNQCRVLVELEERKSIFGLSENFNSDLFTDIWGELKDIPHKFQKYLFQILPIAHQCRGNVHLSSLLLAFVLNEKVTITVDAAPQWQPNAFPANELNKRYLGADFILGNNTPAYDAVYKIKIGPVKGKISNYMQGGENEKIMLFLLDYFIPFDANFEVELILEKDSKNLFLRHEENCCFLGYDSKI